MTLFQRIMKKGKDQKGFTLAELLIVVAIIGVLVAISIPIFTAQRKKAQLAVNQANARSAYAAVVYAGEDEHGAWDRLNNNSKGNVIYYYDVETGNISSLGQSSAKTSGRGRGRGRSGSSGNSSNKYGLTSSVGGFTFNSNWLQDPSSWNIKTEYKERGDGDSKILSEQNVTAWVIRIDPETYKVYYLPGAVSD